MMFHDLMPVPDWMREPQKKITQSDAFRDATKDRHINWLFAQARASGDPYHYADALNAMKPGQCIKLPIEEIAFIQGTWFRSGWRIVLENTIGSAHESCWTFREYEDGRVCCKGDG